MYVIIYMMVCVPYRSDAFVHISPAGDMCACQFYNCIELYPLLRTLYIRTKYMCFTHAYTLLVTKHDMLHELTLEGNIARSFANTSDILGVKCNGDRVLITCVQQTQTCARILDYTTFHVLYQITTGVSLWGNVLCHRLPFLLSYHRTYGSNDVYVVNYTTSEVKAVLPNHKKAYDFGDAYAVQETDGIVLRAYETGDTIESFNDCCCNCTMVGASTSQLLMACSNRKAYFVIPIWYASVQAAFIRACV